MKKVVIADLEANGLLDTATKVWCGVFKNARNKHVTKFTPTEIPKMLEFMDTIDVIIMHNGVDYDLPLLEKLYGYKFKGKVIDTLILSRLYKPKRSRPVNMPPRSRGGPHSLEAWGYRLGRGKPEHEDWNNYSPEMLHRCTEDVEITDLVFRALREEEKGYDWKHAKTMTTKLFQILHEQSKYGWLVDREYMERCISLLTKWIEKIDSVVQPTLPMKAEIEKKIKGGESHYFKDVFKINGDYYNTIKDWYEKTGLDSDSVRVAGPFCRVTFRPVDISKPDEVKSYLLEQGWKPAEWNYKKDKFGKDVKDENGNKIKTSPKMSYKDPFEGVEGRTGRLVARRVQCLHRRSTIEGWIKLIREDGRVSTPVSGLAETGRAKHRGIVNVPGTESFFGKQMRKCFICKPGYKIVGTDSAGCQNRMLAARVGNEFFTRTLLEGKKEDESSIHYVNKAAIEKELGFPITYGNSKNLNYAFMFGASDSKLGSIINHGKEVGTRIRKAMLGVAPGFSELVEDLTKEWRQNAKKRKVSTKYGRRTEYYNGWIAGLDGRPIFISSEHQILVYMLQSDEAIMMTHAYCLLYHRAHKRGWKHGVDWGFLIWYHDEFQCEVKEEIASEFAKLAESCIEDAGKYFKINCPHKGESDIGNNWYMTH